MLVKKEEPGSNEDEEIEAQIQAPLVLKRIYNVSPF